MTLRTAGLIAGVLGVILVAVALVANMVKPAAEAAPSASFDTSVVVVTPEVLALSPDAELTISGSGPLAAHTARTDDVQAWTASRDFVMILGIEDWENLQVNAVEPVPSASPSASPSPSGSASVSPSPSASPAKSPSSSASPSASASPSPSAEPSPGPTPLGSQDIWRDTAQQDETYSIETVDVPVGLTLVVESLDGGTISAASMSLPRTIDDDWIGQVLWWGVALSIVGLIALIALFIDVRPAQSKGEEWLAHRSGIGAGKAEPRPGGRRARRAAGSAMPVALIPSEPTTGSIPVVIDASPVTSDVPMIALTGSVPVVQPQPEPPAEHFEPPQANPDPYDQHNEEEDRS